MENFLDDITENNDNDDKIVFNTYNTNIKMIRFLKEGSGAFLWLKVFKNSVMRMSHDDQAKYEMLKLCRQYYYGRQQEFQSSKFQSVIKYELEKIDEFEKQYKDEQDALHWYTRANFLFKILNKALRVEDPVVLYSFRYYIQDLSKSISKEYEKMKENQKEKNELIFKVYRGCRLSKENIENLKANIGNLLSPNGYLSSSRSKNVAQNFTQTNRQETFPILFEIEINLDIKTLIVADIAHLSAFSSEQEVLFDLATTFKIHSYSEDSAGMLIFFLQTTDEGSDLASQWIEIIDYVSLQQGVEINFGLLLTDIGESKKSLKYFENLLLNEKDEIKKAYIYRGIGNAYSDMDNYLFALKSYENAYTILRCSAPLMENELATILTSIASIYHALKKNHLALQYLYKALYFADNYRLIQHAARSIIFENLADIYCDTKDFKRAEYYYNKALETYDIIDIKHASDNFRPDVGRVLLKFAALKQKMDDTNDNILFMLENSLNHLKSTLPATHHSIENNLYQMARALYFAKSYHNALNFALEDLKLLKLETSSVGSSNHQTTFLLLGEIYEKLDELDKSIEYFTNLIEILDIQNISFMDIVIKIGELYRKNGEFESALKHYEKYLTVFLQNRPNETEATASLLFNMGSICHNGMNDYQKALDYFKKSYELYQTITNENESNLNNLSRVCFNIGVSSYAIDNYATALEYFEKSLFIVQQMNPINYEFIISIKQYISSTNLAMWIYNKLTGSYSNRETYAKNRTATTRKILQPKICEIRFPPILTKTKQTKAVSNKQFFEKK